MRIHFIPINSASQLFSTGAQASLLARLREARTGNRLILLQLDTQAGMLALQSIFFAFFLALLFEPLLIGGFAFFKF